MTRQPNVVLVLTDDQGYGDLACLGNRHLQTPWIDRFHGESIRLTDFHVGTTCAPTRAGLLTGRYCNSAGVWHTVGGRSLLRADEWTLADALRGAGYHTGHFGKWHLGDSPPFRPHERGFNETVYHAGGGIGNTADHWGNDYFDDTYFVNGKPRKFQGYCTDVFFREAISFIERNRERPLFCYIAPNAPHGPWNVEPRYRDRYRDVTANTSRAGFYGMITNIDENFGLLRAALRDMEIEDNTVLMFMTDNGTAMGVDLDPSGFPQEGQGSYNAGMRGQKGSPYEGGHRVPFFLRAPHSGLQHGRDILELTSYIDLMPTVLDLCGVEVPQGHSFHGTSLVPLLRGDPANHAALAERTVVTDTQRVARPVKWRNSCSMKGPWRLVHAKELYNLDSDPAQRTDIAAQHPKLVLELRAGYEQWWELVSEQFHLDTPVELGGTEETVMLTTHDIRNESGDTAWNQRHVRQAYACSGYWAVDVRKRGRYRVELRRWPQETTHSITDGIAGDDVSWRKDAVEERFQVMYTGGSAVAVEWARLEIGGQVLYREVTADDRAVAFDIDLDSGPAELYASLHDRDERTMAPYYIHVTLLNTGAQALDGGK